MDTLIHPSIHYMHACMHAYMHTYIHTYTVIIQRQLPDPFESLTAQLRQHGDQGPRVGSLL